jgi:hypothetical protein
MKRRHLWLLAVVGLYAGCAAHPRSETQAVASRILHERSAAKNCKHQQIYYCQTDVNSKACACVDYRDVFGPMWGPASGQAVR